MDYYKTLGVDKNATETDIKKAYRKLAQENHPDTGKGNEARFKEVTEAYEVLGDKQKRAQYDQFGSVGGGGAGFGGGGFGGFNPNDFQNVQFDFGGGFGDIFDSFFGGGGGRRTKTGPRQGNSIEMVLQISFEEAVFGATKEIEVSRYEACGTCSGKGAAPGSSMKNCQTCSGTGQQVKVQRTPLGNIQTAVVCAECDGQGQVPEKKCEKCHGEGRMLKTSVIKAKIPAGVHDRAVIRLKEKGEAGAQGGPYGDLFLHISVAPSKEFERIKDDIHTREHIHIAQAVLGDEIEIRTVHGKASLKIPAGTQSGTVLRLKGEGVPRVGAGTRGDHHVRIIVDTPEKPSGKERKLYEELAKEAKLDINPQSRGLFG